MKSIVDIKKILKLLPHRYPFLLVDRIVEMERGKSVVGIKNVTFNEPFFVGHFPDYPVMPGVLVVEAMAQTGAVLALSSVEGVDIENSVIYFMGIDSARFRKPVVPGDQLVIKCELIRFRKSICKLKAECYVDDELVADAILLSVLREKNE